MLIEMMDVHPETRAARMPALNGLDLGQVATRVELGMCPGKLQRVAPGSKAMQLAVDEIYLDMLPAAEAERVANASTIRQIQFATGRAAAQVALRKLGYAVSTLPIGSMREPVWPEETVGSITHTGRCALAWVARRSDYAGLGVDVERVRQLPNPAWSILMSEHERFWTMSWDDRQLAATALSSAKKSIYKAVFPTVRRFVGFDEVELAFDPRRNRLIVYPATRLAAELDGMQLQINVTVGTGSVMSWAVLHAAEADQRRVFIDELADRPASRIRELAAVQDLRGQGIIGDRTREPHSGAINRSDTYQ